MIEDAIAYAKIGDGFVVSLNVYGSNGRAMEVYEGLGFRAVKTREAVEDVSGVAVYMEWGVG